MTSDLHLMTSLALFCGLDCQQVMHITPHVFKKFDREHWKEDGLCMFLSVKLFCKRTKDGLIAFHKQLLNLMWGHP